MTISPDSPALPPLPTVEGGFKTVLADPPWRFTNRTGKIAPEHKRLGRYGTMSFEEICDLPVDDVTAKNSHLYLWVPNALLPEGIKVMQAWGYRYVSNVIWAKRRKDGGPDGRGVGFYFRNVTEPILFGVKGSMRTLDPARSTVNMIESRKREHSRKPDEQYDLIESCSPGPYLEMFARYAREGWSAWGDESDEDVTPRGQVHRGYQGGAMETVPFVEPHERMPERIAGRIAKVLAEEYRGGSSIRQLADETEYSITRVRSLLTRANVEFRSRGRQEHAELDNITPVSAVGDWVSTEATISTKTGKRADPFETISARR